VFKKHHYPNGKGLRAIGEPEEAWIKYLWAGKLIVSITQAREGKLGDRLEKMALR